MDKQTAYNAYMEMWRKFSIFCRNHPDVEDVTENEKNDTIAHLLSDKMEAAFGVYDAISQENIIEGS